MTEAPPELPESPRPTRKSSIPRIQRLKQRYGISNGDKSKKRTRRPRRRQKSVPPRPPPMVRWSTATASSNQAPPKKPPNNRERKLQASVDSGVNIDTIPLKRIRFDTDADTRESIIAAVDTRQPLSNILHLPPRQRQQSEFTVVFCVRRAGCGDCRDNGLRLTELAHEYGSRMNLFGIIKGVEKGARLGDRLTKFYTEYFSFPLYEDTDNNAFRFLGNRKLSVWKLLRSVPRLEAHYKRNNIENKPFGGDLFTKGGVLLFDKMGQLRYVYYEQYGTGLDLDVLRSAIESMKSEEHTAATSSAEASSEADLPLGALVTSASLHGSVTSHSSRNNDNSPTKEHIPRSNCQAPRRPRRSSLTEAPRKPVRNKSPVRNTSLQRCRDVVDC